jgi:hypothetical protein
MHGPHVTAKLFLKVKRELEARIVALETRLALYESKPRKRGRWFAPIERQVKDA